MRTSLAAHRSFEPAVPKPSDLQTIALLLDVDGTLLDMAITPGSVVVPRSLRATLENLHDLSGGAVALVSGRLIRNLDALFAPLRLPAIGGHGAEMRLSGSDTTQVRHPTIIGAALRRLIDHIADLDPRIILEDKGYSIAIHYRLVPQIEHSLKLQIQAMLQQIGLQDLEIMTGKAVFELKSPNFSKGEAVSDMMRSSPFLYRTPVFIGDDTTDESVFRVLPKLGGFGYSVERPIAGAVGTFNSPYEVRRWLARLCRSEGSVGE